MPYYLNNPTTSNVGVELTTPVSISETGTYIEIKGIMGASPNLNAHLVSNEENYDNRIKIQAADLETSLSGSKYNFSSGYVQPPAGSDFTIVFEKVSGTSWEATLNEVLLGAVTNGSGQLIFNQFFRGKQDITTVFVGGFYSIEIGNRVSDTVISRWENTSGTGLTFTDVVGGNNGTLVGAWPTDDSQWVFFEGDSVVIVAPTNAPVIDSGSITTTTEAVSGTFTFDEAANTEDPATAYEVRVDGGAWQQTADPAALSFSVSGLTPNTTYNTPGVEVRALNSGGAGPVSDAVSFTTEALYATPVNLSITNIQTDRVRLNWERG